MSGTPTVRSSGSARNRGSGVSSRRIRARRWLFFALVGLTALTGTGMMLDIVRTAGVTLLEIAILLLFAATFTWICVAFWNAVIGFALRATGRDAPSPASLPIRDAPNDAVVTRTALVMPIHNEDPTRVMRRLSATIGSLVATGEAARFAVHVLSDTTDEAIAREERAVWATFSQHCASTVSFHYRRRPANVGRKAGNIADFCQRWGARYDFMVVLDADSVMSGQSLVALVRAMQADPVAGLIQTVPVPIRQRTLFGRLLQFAACVYSPMIATGQSFWQGDAANYWGHNAILRLSAFIDHCDLPVLRGEPPWGGEILSHDFVEAALLRRAGWHVYLLPSVGGSYEELPGTILDYATRDRRWAQGSLQHLRLLLARGLHPISRLHFVLGAMGYVSSLLWLLMLLTSTAYVVLESSQVVLATIVPYDMLATWPLLGARSVLSLLLVTAVILFVPKLLALGLALARHRRSFGGAGRLVVSALVEMVFAVVSAPLMMMYHCRSVLSVLTGHTVQWGVQRRHGMDVPWPTALRKTCWISGIGVAWLGVTLTYSPSFVPWLAPILAGLLLAAPLVRITSSAALGDWARKRGLLLVPSETADLGHRLTKDVDPASPPLVTQSSAQIDS